MASLVPILHPPLWRVERPGGENTIPIKRLKEFLDEHEVNFVSISHSQAFTAQEIAAAAHLPGKELAKSVMVKLDGQLAMAVLPAPDQISVSRLKEISGAGNAEIASEEDFADLFTGCELGAMPPSGTSGISMSSSTRGCARTRRSRSTQAAIPSS